MTEFDAVTPYPLVHLSAGYYARRFGLSFRQHLIAHILFEIAENTFALPLFQRLDPYDPFSQGPYMGDTLANSVTDVLAGVIGYNIKF